MLEEMCENCKWWAGFEEARQGNCHRFPPSIKRLSAYSFGYPPTDNNDWCGEFEAEEEE